MPTKKKRQRPVRAPRSAPTRKPPAFVTPMAAQVVKRLPEGDDWIYELKFDGYRALIIKDGQRVELRSRKNKDLTGMYRGIAAAGLRLNADQAVVDGEIVALDAQGSPSFQALQHRGSHPGHQIVFYVFDVLHLDGTDLTSRPLLKRRARLARVLERGGYRPAGSNGIDALLVGYYDDSGLRFAGKVRAGFVPHLRREVFKALKPHHVMSVPSSICRSRRHPVGAVAWRLTNAGNADEPRGRSIGCRRGPRGGGVSVIAELKRRNVVRVAVLYGLVAWLLLQVAEVLFGVLDLPGWAGKFVFGLLVLGFPLVLIFSWVYELTPEGLKKQHEVDREPSITRETGRKINYLIGALAAIAIVVVTLDRFVPRTDRALDRPAGESAPAASTASEKSDALSPSAPAAIPQKSIAVLPFVNISSDPEQEYFSDGLSEELLNLLVKLPELKVIARTSSFAYKGKHATIEDIARELRVAHVLEGSVRKSGDKVRITAQLIRAADSTHLWSETYDRTLEDIFAVQGDIAGQVVKALEVTLLGDEPAAPQDPQDLEAYNLLLQGRVFARRSTSESSERALKYLQQSLERNPSYAPAWVELANVYLAQADWYWAPAAGAYIRARKATEKALALDPNLASAHVAMGWIQRYDLDWAAAEASFRRALALESGNADALLRAGWLAAELDRPDEALRLIGKSLDLDPLNVAAYDYLSSVFDPVGQYNDALAACLKAQELSADPTQWSFCVGYSLLVLGKAEEALREIDRATDEQRRLLGRSLAYHTLGRRADADAALASLKDKYGSVMPFRIAEAHAWRGENDLAFAWLERAYALRDAQLLDIRINSTLKRLEEDPRYRALLRRMKFPE